MNAAQFMYDPGWADFIPELKSGGPKCRLPQHEDCSPIDPDTAAECLKPGGALGRMEGYETRPGQLDMLVSDMLLTEAFTNSP